MDYQKLKSDEERQFADWLSEAEQYGLISEPEYEPKSYQLSDRVSIQIIQQLKTKIKTVDKFLLHPHKYTADFTFIINHNPLLKNFVKIDEHEKVVVDTKGGFMNRGERQEFAINRKWVMQKYGVYVNKIIPKKLFKLTWCPEVWRYTPKTGKPAKMALGCFNIREYIDQSKGS